MPGRKLLEYITTGKKLANKKQQRNQRDRERSKRFHPGSPNNDRPSKRQTDRTHEPSEKAADSRIANSFNDHTGSA